MAKLPLGVPVIELEPQFETGVTGSGDVRYNIQMARRSDGVWYHEGRAFQRKSLIKLFAGVLRKEGEKYFLLTPAEKLKISVDDAPFVATLLEVFDENEQQALVFTTNLGDKIVADKQHPIRVEIDTLNGKPRPYILFHDGLEALISRTAFFDLANLAEAVERDGRSYLTISSMGTIFELGEI